jgi:hypothetical protein
MKFRAARQKKSRKAWQRCDSRGLIPHSQVSGDDPSIGGGEFNPNLSPPRRCSNG